jgi:hypothetical protein
MQLPLYAQRRLNRHKPALRLYWWRYRYPEKLNFGDEITPIIIKRLWGLDCMWADVEDCEIIGAGSIIHIFQDVKTKNKIKAWGSGFIKEGSDNKNNMLDFFAVRGPLTAERVQWRRPKTFGDPGILANRVFTATPTKSYRVGVVAHYIDVNEQLLKKIADNPEYFMIDPLQSPEKVAMDITSCEYILSSSLHGLIFADSFGVPNNWMPLSGNVAGGSYKFEDYYQSTGRNLVRKNAATILGNGDLIDQAIQEYQAITNLKQMQRDLIRAFPYKIDFRIKPAIAFVLSPSKLKKLFR